MQSIREIISLIKHPSNRELREREKLSLADRKLLREVESITDYNPVQDWEFRRETAPAPRQRDLRTFSIEIAELGKVTIGRGWYRIQDQDRLEEDQATNFFLQLVDPSGKVARLTLSESAIAERIFVSLSQRREFAQASLPSA